MSDKKSILGKLKDSAFRPQHDYRVSLQIFPDLNIDKVAEDMDLARVGGDRGEHETPPATSISFDEVEMRIGERIRSAQKSAYSRLSDELRTYDDRLSGLDFEGRFADLRQAAPEAVSSFKAEAMQGRDELNPLRRALREANDEKSDFQKRHNLTRAARPTSMAVRVFKLGLLPALLLFETIVNGQFLAAGNEGGLLGGFSQAFVFAFLNLLVSFGLGYLGVRYLNRKGLVSVLWGMIALVTYLAFAFGLNLGLAHFRDIAASVGPDAGRAVIERLSASPFRLADINSWSFFGFGLVFSIIAFLDGLFFSDPYPGYGEVHQRWLRAYEAYSDRKSALIDELKAIRDETSDNIKEAQRDLAVRRSEHDAILQASGQIIEQFAQFERHLEEAGNGLMQRYREANQRKRSTKAPKHFAKPWSLERMKIQIHANSETAREDLRAQIRDSQSMLEQQVAAIHEEFDRAVSGYHQIDALVDEAPLRPRPALEGLPPTEARAV